MGVVVKQSMSESYFVTLEAGDIFLYADTVYMKIDEVSREDKVCNAIDLRCGAPKCFFVDAMVRKYTGGDIAVAAGDFE